MQLQLQQLLPVYFESDQRSDSQVWRNNLTINKGEYVKIVAPSGSGKSSLMHFMYGVRNEYNGNILFNGKNIRSFSAEELAGYRSNQVSMVFQDLRLFPEQTVFENIELKRQLQPFHPAEKIREMAERLGIGNKLTAKSRLCSYGEQQRVAIIRALMQPFDFLLLDEPFSHLDDANAQKAMELMLEECRLRNAAMVFANLERVDYFPFTQLFHL
jgi:putative ABC transport system ATP-binding protein